MYDSTTHVCTSRVSRKIFVRKNFTRKTDFLLASFRVEQKTREKTKTETPIKQTVGFFGSLCSFQPKHSSIINRTQVKYIYKRIHTQWHPT